MESLGILGGGQLAWFLAKEANKMQVPVQCFIQSKNETVFQKGIECVIDDSQDSLRNFCDRHTFILFESECFPLERLEKLSDLATNFVPSLQSMKILANKFSQKKLWTKLDLATAAYQKVDSIHWEDENQQWVLKTAHGGYDGKGNYFVKPGENLEHRQKFIHQHLSRDIQVYAEKFISYEKELALVATRSRDGRMVFLPLVETVQEVGVCKEVFNLYDPKGEQNHVAQSIATKIAEKCNLVGTFAVEFFMNKQQELIINEMAPRVHNSGHFSMERGFASQFNNHLRAILNLPLIQHKSNNFFIMLNLLGPQGWEGQCSPPEIPGHLNANLYWYEKNLSKPYRKLGHINIAANSKTELEDEKKQIVTLIKNWRQK